MNELPKHNAVSAPPRSKARLAATVFFLLLPSLALVLTHGWVLAGINSPLGGAVLVVMLGVCIGGWIYALVSLLARYLAVKAPQENSALKFHGSESTWSLVCSWHHEPAIVVDRNGMVLGSNGAAASELGLLPGVPLRMSLATRGFTENSADQLKTLLDSYSSGPQSFELHRTGNPSATRVGAITGHRGGPWLLTVPFANQPQPMDRRLHRAERLASIGQLVAGIVHEINTPLTIILGFAELARRPDADDATVQEHLTDIVQETRRAANIAEMLLHVSRHQDPQCRPVDVQKLLDRCSQLVRINFKDLDLNILRNYTTPAPLPAADENHLLQVFLNLIINAAQALQQARSENPTITLTTTLDTTRQRLRIGIRDNGPGIPPELQARIFEPFFTTKTGTGTGLGLPVTRELLRDLGGEIAINTPVAGGAEFTISLPLGAPPASEPTK